MNPINKIKLGIVVHTIRNTNDDKIADFVEEYSKREFRGESRGFLEVVADKFVAIGITIRRRIK